MQCTPSEYTIYKLSLLFNIIALFFLNIFPIILKFEVFLAVGLHSMLLHLWAAVDLFSCLKTLASLVTLNKSEQMVI